MTIRTGDTVKFLDGYGNQYWVVISRGKRRAEVRGLGKPDSLIVRTDLDNLTLIKAKGQRR